MIDSTDKGVFDPITAGHLSPAEYLTPLNHWFPFHWEQLLSAANSATEGALDDHRENLLQRNGTLYSEELQHLQIETGQERVLMDSDGSKRQFRQLSLHPSSCLPLLGTRQHPTEDAAALPGYPEVIMVGTAAKRNVVFTPDVTSFGSTTITLAVSDGTAVYTQDVAVTIEPTDCGRFIGPPNSLTTFPEGTLYNATAYQACEEGYVPASKGTTKRCEWDGLWYGQTIVCLPEPVFPEFFVSRLNAGDPPSNSTLSLFDPLVDDQGPLEDTIPACDWKWSSWSSWSPCYQHCGVEGWRHRWRSVLQRSWYQGEVELPETLILSQIFLPLHGITAHPFMLQAMATETTFGILQRRVTLVVRTPRRSCNENLGRACFPPSTMRKSLTAIGLLLWLR